MALWRLVFEGLFFGGGSSTKPDAGEITFLSLSRSGSIGIWSRGFRGDSAPESELWEMDLIWPMTWVDRGDKSLELVSFRGDLISEEPGGEFAGAAAVVPLV